MTTYEMTLGLEFKAEDIADAYKQVAEFLARITDPTTIKTVVLVGDEDKKEKQGTVYRGLTDIRTSPGWNES